MLELSSWDQLIFALGLFAILFPLALGLIVFTAYLIGEIILDLFRN